MYNAENFLNCFFKKINKINKRLINLTKPDKEGERKEGRKGGREEGREERRNEEEKENTNNHYQVF